MNIKAGKGKREMLTDKTDSEPLSSNGSNNSEIHNYKDPNNYHMIKINSIPIISKYSQIYTQEILQQQKEQDDKELKIYCFDTFKQIIDIGLPTTFFFLCLYLQQTISLSFVGKKYNDENMINAIGIVNLYINCTFFCFVVGLISGLDTLLSNALGSNNMYLFGIYVHRARLITYILSTILCIFHLIFAKKLISFFGVNETILNYCTDLIPYSLAYVMLDIQFGINFRVLSILGKSKVCLIILLITVVLHPLWCYIFIIYFKMNVKGAGVSLILSQLINMILSTIYVHFTNPLGEGNFSLNRECFRGWIDYLKFTLPSTFMLCAEWLAFEIQAIFAMKISPIDYSIHIFVSNLASLMYTLCTGFGLAATILIGQNIAKGKIQQSKALAVYAFIFAEITMSFVIILLILFKESVLSIFVDDNNSLMLTKGRPVIVILAIGEIFDITQSVMGSIYRGLGKQRQASLIAFFQYYISQTLLTCLFCFYYKLEIQGIWYSILFGNLLTTLVYIYFFTKFNFEKINTETQARLDKDQKLISPKLEEKKEKELTNIDKSDKKRNEYINI
jgi:MATE family multidrug resistance protein